MEDPEVKDPGRGELAGSVVIHFFVVLELTAVALAIKFWPGVAFGLVAGLIGFNAVMVLGDWRRLLARKKRDWQARQP